MVRLRRNDDELRIEIMPLIDVIFLLLTFFIYAMVLMVRVDLLGIEVDALASAEAATPGPAATIAIRLDGNYYLDGEQIALNELPARLSDMKSNEPEIELYIALEQGEAAVDRGPLWQKLWDTLQPLGLEMKFVSAPPAPPGSDAPRTPTESNVHR